MYPKHRINYFNICTSILIYIHTRVQIILLFKKETFHLVDILILADQNNWEIFQGKKNLQNIPLTQNIELIPHLITLDTTPGVVFRFIQKSHQVKMIGSQHNTLLVWSFVDWRLI